LKAFSLIILVNIVVVMNATTTEVTTDAFASTISKQPGDHYYMTNPEQKETARDTQAAEAEALRPSVADTVGTEQSEGYTSPEEAKAEPVKELNILDQMKMVLDQKEKLQEEFKGMTQEEYDALGGEEKTAAEAKLKTVREMDNYLTLRKIDLMWSSWCSESLKQIPKEDEVFTELNDKVAANG
jgi:hypothetical protein